MNFILGINTLSISKILEGVHFLLLADYPWSNLMNIIGPYLTLDDRR